MSQSSSTVSRDQVKAKEAFREMDIELSIAAHDAKKGTSGDANEDHAGSANDYVKSLIFGGLDGIVTTFAIVCAIVGADMHIRSIVIIGISNVFADGISMGLGDYISSKAEKQATEQEYAREKWELENYPEGEYKEMIEIYEKMGLTPSDAYAFVDIMKKYPKFFLDKMFVDELGLMPPQDEELWKQGLVMFCSFVFFGCIPVLTYIIAIAAGDSNKSRLFGITIGTTALTLFFLGFTAGKLTKQNPGKSGLLMMINGGLAAAAAYFVGWALDALLK